MPATLLADHVVGVFDTRAAAEAAIGELWRAGFAHDTISLVTRDGLADLASPSKTAARQEQAADGAATGAAVGAGAGLVAGAVAVSLIPGVGPLAAGTMVAGALGGAALGAAGGTFLGPFVALRMADRDARRLARHVEQGRSVLVVRTTERQEEARVILDRHNAHGDEGE